MASAREVLRFYRDFSRALPDEASCWAALLNTPDGMPVVAMLMMHTGALAEAERILRPAREFGTPIADLVQPMPYVVYQSIIDAGFAGHGLHRYWKSAYDENLSDARSDLLVRGGENLASPLSAIIIILMHGAAARVAPDATAFGARDTMGFGRRFAVVRPGGLLLSPENRSARWKLCPCSKWITPVLTSLAPVVHLGIKMGA